MRGRAARIVASFDVALLAMGEAGDRVHLQLGETDAAQGCAGRVEHGRVPGRVAQQSPAEPAGGEDTHHDVLLHGHAREQARRLEAAAQAQAAASRGGQSGGVRGAEREPAGVEGGSPQMRLTRVVLPAPFGPIRA